MTDTQPDNAWPSLREFLDAGGDFEAVLRADGSWPHAAETLFLEIPRHLPSHRAAHGQRWRIFYEEPTPMANGEIWVGTFEQRRGRSWECDLYENPDLLERVMKALSPEAIAEGQRQFNLYKTEALKILVPSYVRDDRPFWGCDSCLRPFPPTVPAIITGQDDTPNCRDCVAAVLARYDRGEVDVRENTDA